MLAREFLNQYGGDIDWVLAEFGNYSASDLELLSTIVFADREAVRNGNPQTMSELARKVKDVKPHFPESYIQEKVGFLEHRVYFQACVVSKLGRINASTGVQLRSLS